MQCHCLCERRIWIKQKISDLLVRYLTGKVRRYQAFSVSSTEDLLSVLQRADVILVEGDQRFSTAVKYLTQSTWSHAALFVGAADVGGRLDADTPSIIEADLKNGLAQAPMDW